MKMKSLNLLAFSALATLTLVSGLISAKSASAQPAGFDGSYVGAGVSAGATSGGQGNDPAAFGGNIQGRFAIPQSPVSVRGAVLWTDQTSAIMPMLSYDVPVSNNANVYVGGGYSFVESPGKNTPLGNRNSVVLTVGAEAEVVKDVVVYGDTKFGINAYQNSPASALSFQAGVGYRF